MVQALENRWLVGGVLLVLSLLWVVMAFAQFADVYGDVYGNVMGDVYMEPLAPSTYPQFILPPPPGATQPSVQMGPNGLTYTYPGNPAVVVPPLGQGQSYIYFGQNGGPDIIMTPDGKITYAYPGGSR
jgi:hypothetical protein